MAGADPSGVRPSALAVIAVIGTGTASRRDATDSEAGCDRDASRRGHLRSDPSHLCDRPSGDGLHCTLGSAARTGCVGLHTGRSSSSWPTARIAGGCIGQDAAGMHWDCYVGQVRRRHGDRSRRISSANQRDRVSADQVNSTDRRRRSGSLRGRARLRDRIPAAVATERSHRGLVQRFAKPPCGVTCIEGSNPSLSASLRWHSAPVAQRIER